MKLNSLSPAEGSKKNRKRVGSGIGSGIGKTAGCGHKGQKSRSGGYHKVGFEGGQMPLQRRLPKVGFASRMAQDCAEIRLHELNNLPDEVIDVAALRKAGLVSTRIRRAKVIVSGAVDKAVRLKGIKASKGARQAIESAGGSVED